MSPTDAQPLAPFGASPRTAKMPANPPNMKTSLCAKLISWSTP